VLTIRVSPALSRRLDREARRRRRTRSETARAILEGVLHQTEPGDPDAGAPRQSILASSRTQEQDALDFVISVADFRDWK
jgi:hypothetical protein